MAFLILQLLFRRTLLAVPILLCVSALVFIIMRLLPADPVAMSLPPGATLEDYAKLKTAFGLDRSLPEQYLIWLKQLMQGEFGNSIFFRRPVSELVAKALPATLELVGAALVIGILGGMAGGLIMFAQRGRATEQVLDGATTVMMAIPEFLWAILFILFFGVTLQWLPFIGRLTPQLGQPPSFSGFLLLDALIARRWDVFSSALQHLVLPACALSIGIAPLVMRVLRASLFETIQDDYVTQARLRGLTETQILLRHALPNAALPTISLIGVQGGFMFGGTLLVELIFAYPGLGNLMIDAVRNHDLPVIQTVALLYCILVLGVNALVDILTIAINPKLRLAEQR